jgi:hypothetical protein
MINHGSEPAEIRHFDETLLETPMVAKEDGLDALKPAHRQVR